MGGGAPVTTRPLEATGPMLLAYLLCVAPCGESPWSPGHAVVDPYASHSPDGRWTVAVAPSDRSGLEDARIVLTGPNGAPLERTLPFAPQAMCVTDDGVAVGFGYDDAPRPAPGEADSEDFGFLVLIALAPDGSLRWEHREPMRGSRGMHTGPEPVVSDLAVQPTLERVVFLAASTHFDPRGGGDREQALWFHALTDGARIAARDLGAPHVSQPLPHPRLQSVDAIPGQGLLLLRWAIRERRPAPAWLRIVAGPEFVLEDGAGAVVWREAWPGDHSDVASKEADYELQELIRHRPPVLAVDAAGFDLWCVQDGERVRFDVERAEGGAVQVVATGRTAYPRPPAVRAWGPIVAPLALERVGRFQLAGDAPVAAPLARVVACAPLEDGAWTAILRGNGQGAPTFEVATFDAEGALDSCSPVPGLPAGLRPWNLSWGHVGGGRWWGLQGDHEVGPVAVAVEAFGAAPSEAPFSAAVEAAIADLGHVDWDAWDVAPDGRFAVLLDTPVWPAIATYTADGAPSWSTLGDPAEMQQLPLVRDIAWAADGRLVGVDHEGVLVLFGDTGEIELKAPLKELTGVKPNYVTRLERAPHGELLVEDFHGDPALIRVRPSAANSGAAMTLVGALSPRLADGSVSADRASKAHLDQQGRVWTLDRHAFLRLDDEGRVVERLGAATNAFELASPRLSAVLPDRLIAQDEATGHVFAFSHEGEALWVALSEPQDQEQYDSIGRIEEAPDGTLWIERDDRMASRWSVDGRRLDTVDLGRLYQFSPAPRGVWRWGYDGGAALHAPDSTLSETLTRIERSIDGRWLRRIEDVEATPDGRVHVLQAADNWDVLDAARFRARELVTYSAVDGALAAERALAAPACDDRFEIVGDWALFSRYRSRVVLVRLSTEEWFSFEPPDAVAGHTWSHGLAADGRRLVSFDQGSRELHHFWLPES